MPNETNNVPASTPPMSTVPRAVWIGGGLLSVVTAGLAGALIMRSAEPARTVSVAAAPAASAIGQVPVPVHPVLVPAAAQAKAVHHAKPAAPAEISTPANTSAQAQWSPPGGTTHAAFCASCGVVESVKAVQEKGQGSGLGAVAGGVVGGLVGHQVGGGSGKTAMTVLGALGGGLAGNEVEKRVRSETLFDIQVRMEDGSTREFHQPQSLAVGTRVVAEGTTLRLARDTGTSDEPRMVRTSTGGRS